MGIDVRNNGPFVRSGNTSLEAWTSLSYVVEACISQPEVAPAAQLGSPAFNQHSFRTRCSLGSRGGTRAWGSRRTARGKLPSFNPVFLTPCAMPYQG
ncbi:hypothetical protein IG631_12974 [Alternaria alternata]|nr:hypothetical protein IG631_12974 [Alternaria alternata]